MWEPRGVIFRRCSNESHMRVPTLHPSPVRKRVQLFPQRGEKPAPCFHGGNAGDISSPCSPPPPGTATCHRQLPACWLGQRGRKANLLPVGNDFQPQELCSVGWETQGKDLKPSSAFLPVAVPGWTSSKVPGVRRGGCGRAVWFLTQHRLGHVQLLTAGVHSLSSSPFLTFLHRHWRGVCL